MQRFMRPSAIVIGLGVASLLLAHVSGGPIGAPAVRDRGLRLDPTNKFTRVGVPRRCRSPIACESADRHHRRHLCRLHS